MKKYKFLKTAMLTPSIALLSAGAVDAYTNTFEDVTDQVGLAGIAVDGMAEWCDVDRDGWVDLYCAGSLWRNMEGQSFQEVENLPSKMSGAGTWGDYNNDGYPDFFNFRNQRLFRNNGGTEFEDVTTEVLPDLGNSIESRGAVWGDFNNSGFLDLYIGGYETWTDTENVTYPDMILMNRGGDTFELVWSQTQYRARGINACDFDQDNDLDIYVSNYRLQPNVLRVNDGTGVFENKAAEYNVLGIERSWAGGHSIGAAWGDLDNDGLFDLFSGNFSHRGEYWGNDGIQPESDFFRNRGPDFNYYFEDKGTCGVVWQESFASPTLGDFDNDGFLDLYFTTVYSPNVCVLYVNNGDWTFSNASIDSNLRAIIGTTATYQGAWADFDNDGDLDLISGGILMRNTGNDNHWLKIRPVGTGRINAMALGTQVRLKSGTSTYTRQVESATGQGNCNDHTLHFGLGSNPSLPLEMTVLWTDGTEQKMLVHNLDQTLTVEKNTQSIHETALRYETFEVAEGMIAGRIHGQKNWLLNAGSNAVVQTAEVYLGAQALEIDRSAAAYYQKADAEDLWIRFHARLTSVPTVLSEINDPDGITMLVNTNSHLMVYNGTVPVELDVSMPLNTWVAFDIYCNCTTRQWTLSLDGITVAENLYAPGLYHQTLKLLEFENTSDSPLYVDQVAIYEQEPAGLPDADEDGMPDWWELKYSGSITSAAPDAVASNGHSFLQTYIAGIPPDAAMPFRVELRSDNQGVYWDSQLNRVYDVEWTDDLVSGFTCIATNLSDMQNEFVDYGSEEGFYRIKTRLK